MNLTLITALIGLTAATVCAQLPMAELGDRAPYAQYPSKTLDSRADYTVNPANLALSKYGGWLNGPRQTATGFFRVQKVNDRWWSVDPEGYLYIHKALNSVNMDFNTADELYTMMRDYGFNGFGNWTWNGPTGGGPPDRSIIGESTVKDTIPMAYTARFGMIGTYRGARLPAGTPRIELPVFDPGFAEMAPVYAQTNITATLKNDPHLFGYFTDNELPFNTALSDHLSITNQSDPNYLTAVDFLTSRGKTPANYDTTDSTAYTALCGERYYSVVSAAIRAVDPDHMYLGSRCHSGEKGNEQFMRNAGKYVDIMGVNHYHHWGDRRINTNNMAEWLGRPLLFSEFWTNTIADGGANGTGFSGRNRNAQILFYQNYVTTHLESGNLVGFHWFKYGRDIIQPDGSFNNTMMDSMKKMHTQVYDFIDYLDSPRSARDAVITPEADAYFAGGVNYGTAPDLKAQYSSSPLSQWQTYMRFDVSSLTNPVDSAYIVLRNVQSGSKFRVELVEDDSWGETTINSGNAPIGSTLILESDDGRSDVEIDVSSVIRQQIQGDGKLSIRIIGIGSTTTGYGSRENPNPVARPVLIVDHVDRSYWVGGDGTWNNIANWSTASGAATPSPLAKPGFGDNVVFNITNGNSNQIVDFTNGNQAANSLKFNSTGTTTLTKEVRDSSSTSRMLTLGIGGLTVSPTAGNVNIGAANQLIQVGFAASTFFRNDSANTLTLSRQVISSANSGSLTLTINGAGNGLTDFQREIQQSANSTLALDVNTSGGHTTVLRHTGSTFSRGLTLTQGNLALRGSSATIGTGPLTIRGGAIGAVDGARSYTSNLTIRGDFQLGGVTFGSAIANDATFSGTVDLNGTNDMPNTTRTITLGGNTHAFNGPISNGGLNFVSNGPASQLILGASNPFSGPTTVGTNVTLTLNHNGALQNSLLNTDGGGSLNLGGTTNTPTLGGLNGTTNLASLINGNYNLATGLTLNPLSGTASYSGNITEGAVGMTLTKTGSGTQILTGSHGYTGATNVNVGTLAVTGNLTSAVTVANGATLSGTGTTTGTLTLNGGSTIIASTTGNSFKAETVSANSSVKILVLDGSGTIGSRTVGVARYNTGTGPNTANFSTAGFRNGVVSNVGTSGGETQLTYTSEARTWNPAAGTWSTSAIAWQEGDFKFTQGDVVIFDDTGTGGGAARTVTLNSLVSPSGVTFNNSITTPYTVKGTGGIDGLSGLTKTGDGTATLSTSNTYTGLTTVSAGTLTLGHLTDTIDGPITVSGGTLDVANPDTVGAVTLTSGTITGDGTLTGTSYTVESGTVSVSLAGSGGLTKTTSGTVVMSGSSSYSGGTVLNEGRLGLRTSSNPLGTGTVTINGGVIGSVVSTRSVSNNFLINNNFQLGGVNAPGLGNAGTNFNGNIDLGGVTRTITLADGTTIDGDISNGGLTINATSSTRTLTIGFNSVSTYTGPTNINAGTLLVNGSLADTEVTVASGATLGGSGVIGGNTTIAAGGKLAFSLSAPAASHNKLELAAGKSLNFSGTSVLTITATTGAAPDNYVLVTAPGGITGSVPATVSLPSGWVGKVGIIGNDLVLDCVAPTVLGMTNNSGGSSLVNMPVNYTVTFSEDIDASSVSAADFGNAGTSTVTFGAITETSPGVFAVAVTPTSAGTLQLHVNAGAVITDVSGNGLNTASVIFDDTIITVYPPNVAPPWLSNPVNEVNATEDVGYSSTLADNANGVTLTFTKVSGPAWLSIASNGALSGTPTNGDVGPNSFTVSVSDGIAPAVQATLNITVINTNDAPVFVANPIPGSDATEDAAYTDTLAGSASDVDAGASLTYAKVGGPDWLAVASNGALSGTPTSSNVGPNSFTVSVSDGIAPAVTATLNITVVAPLVGFKQSVAGPWDYNTTGNWHGETINGLWHSTLTLAANQTVTFAANTSPTTGLTFNHAGNSSLLLQSSSTTAHTLTLGGNIGLNTGGGTSANVTIGSSSNPLNINLGGAIRTMTVADNRTLTLANIVSSGGITKAGNGTLTLSGVNTYTGNTTVSAGTLKVTGTGRLYTAGHQGSAVVTVQTGGVLELDTWFYGSTQSLGLLAKEAARVVINNGTIRMNGTTNYGRGVTVLAGGAIFEAADGANWTQGGALDYTTNVYTGNPSLTFTGAGNGTYDKVFSGSGSLTKSGAGTWTFTRPNTYTGATAVNAGTLKMGANNVIPDASNVTIGTATLDADTRTDTTGTLDVNGAAVINLGVGAALAFADSKSVDWTGGALNITGTLGATSLRFGDSADDLTSGPDGQLAKISVNGSGLGTYILDANGYLVPSGPGPVASFTISPITSPQTVGTPITGITLTAKDASDATATSFTGTVTFGGTAGITGTSASFTDGVLTGVSVIPTVAGNNLTFTVDDGASHTGSANIITIQPPYTAWAEGGVAFDADTNSDGVDNGMAWILGAANPGESAVEKLPKATLNGSNLRLTFRCLKSNKRGGVVLKVQTSDDIGVTDPWSSHEAAVPDEDGAVNSVVFDTTDDGDYITVIADIPVGDGKLFGRLKVGP